MDTGDGHFNSVGSGNHFPLHTPWKHLVIVPKMHGYFVRWISVMPEDLKIETGAKRRLVQECLQLLGYSRSKWERNQTPAGRLAKQTCNEHSVLLAHQRTDQPHTELHRTSQKHPPPPEEAEAGARIAWLQMTTDIQSSWGVYHSLVTEASTMEGRQAGRT